jgi:imidazolonepropionase-like amidohydrolase
VLLLATLLTAGPLTAQTRGHVTVDIGARDPAVAPDGASVAVSILGRLWSVPIEGGEARALTGGPGWSTRPTWSPDGLFLAYAHRSGSGSDIVILNTLTGGHRFLHHVRAGLGHMQFSPDGEHLYFVDDRSQYDAHLWRIRVEGGEPEQLTFTQNWHEWSFAIAPDGERILIESGRYGGADLYWLDPADKSSERITDTLEREMSVMMTPDGTTRAHIETHNGLDHVVVEAEGRAPERIHTSAFDQKQLATHPDGASAVMVAGRRLYRLDLESGTASPIPFTASFPVADAPPDDLAITNVRLFSATGDEAIEGATVLVEDGRIQAVISGFEPTIPDGMAVVDGSGKTLLPGLMDNHYHYWTPFAGADLLARGVTSIRDPGVAISDGMDFKDAVRHGILAGPDIYSTGPLLDGPGGYHPMVDISLDDPAAAPALVRALKAQGVDALKAYFQLDPEVLIEVVREAKLQGLPVTGHIGVRMSWGQAMDAGIDGFSHLRLWRDFLPSDLQWDGRDESLDSTKNPIGRMQADWSLIDPGSEEVEALIDRMARTGTAIDPTIFIQRTNDNSRTRFSLEQFALAGDAYERMQAFVRKAVESGVPLLAGTDNVRLNDELEAYADAGIPNAEILKAATVNGARWLGKDGDFGTVEPGKRAHLVLVDGNPLEEIEALRNVRLVVKDGTIVFRKGH